ncbi:hypothetical protein F5879DRAFT_926563 [Lentinula edodes]|nr:hypothetical protein F5879DRAFT_926563 [Lentinula edodes]
MSTSSRYLHLPPLTNPFKGHISQFELLLVTEKKLPPLNFHVHYTATDKPKAKNYNATGKAILLQAFHDFKAKVIGLNFFPTIATWAHWAEEAFLTACVNANCAHSSDKCVIQLASHICGDLIKWTHTKIQTVFGFYTDKGKKDNKKIYQGLSAHNLSAFLYKDPDLLTGYAKNPLITTFISYIFSTWIGPLYESYFNSVSLNMLSGFFAVICFTIAEWSTGESKAYKMQESTHLSYITGSIEALMQLELELRTRDTESQDDGMDEDSNHSDNNNPSTGAPRNPSTASSSTEASGNSPAG